MKQIIQIALSALVLVSAFITSGYAQSTGEKTSRVQLGFFPPISTNGGNAGAYTNTVSFSTLVGLSGNVRAFTFAGLANIVRNDAHGIQWAGLYNYVGNEGSGASLAGVANISKTYYRGVQLSGVLNMGNEVVGAQITGVVNLAKKVSGVQFAALVNIADESDYPIGLLNLIKRGEYTLGVQYDEVGTTAITLRTGSRFTYGIIGLGYNYRAHEKTLATLVGLGVHLNCFPWLRVNNEVTVQNIGFSKNSTFITDRTGALNNLPNFRKGDTVIISSATASSIERGMGLKPGSLQNGFKVREISDITSMNPRSPLEGNEYFLGPGQHLPNGAPEMVINSVPTIDNESVTTILTVLVK